MAYVKVVKGSQMLLKVGDGASPEVFAHYCTINAEREFALEANVNEEVQVDCDNPDLPGWVDREIESKSGQISGNGLLNGPDYAEFFEWFESGEQRNVQVVLNVTAPNGGGMVEGAWLLTNLTMTGNRGEKVNVAITLQSTGPLAYDAAA